MTNGPTRLLIACLAVGAACLLPRPGAGQDDQEKKPVADDAREQEPAADPATPRFEAAVDVEAEPPARTPATAATRLPVPVRELPVSLAVVPRRALDDQGALVLADALENVSGINVAAGFGVFDYFVIRGFDSLSSGLVLTDGLPEPESTFYPLYNVRQTEVLKGPASFLHGGNPLSGGVLLARKQPEARRFAHATLGYGRFDTLEASVDGNAASADGTLAARLNATWQGTDAYRDLERGSIAAVNPTLAWRPDERTRLGVDLEYVRSEWPPDTGIPFVGESGSSLAPVPRTRSYQSPFDGSVQDVTRVRLEAERRLGDSVTLHDRLYFTELSWDSDGTLVIGAFPGPDGRLQVARSLVLLDDRQRLFGNQLEMAAAFRTGGVHHDLLLGFEVKSLKDRFTQDVGFLPSVDLLEPVETAQPPVVTIPPLAQRGDSRSLVFAPYLVDRARLSTEVQLFLGARLDVLDYEDPPNATERDATSFNPLLGLTYTPREALALHASWSTASAPPSTQVVGPREPEESRQLEVGAKLALPGGKGFVDVAAYHLERDNVAIPDSSGLARQQGDQRSRGIEVDLSIEPVAGLVTSATYAYTDATLTRFTELVPLQPPDFVVLDRSGNRAPFAPRHVFGLWASRRFDSGLGLALGLRALSDQAVAEDNRYTIAGYARLDAAVSYHRGPWGVRVHLRNLTGTEYETRGFGSASVIPAAPLEVMARVELGFGDR